MLYVYAVCCPSLIQKVWIIQEGIKLGVESNWNSFEIRSIWKLAIRLIRRGKKSWKNSINFNSKFVLFQRKKFEKFANFSNSVFWFEKFEIFPSQIPFLLFNFEFWLSLKNHHQLSCSLTFHLRQIDYNLWWDNLKNL